MKRRWLVLAWLLAAGCGGPPVARPTGTPPPAPVVIHGDLDARVLLGDLPKRAIAAGAGAASVVASGLLGDGERLGAFVEVPADSCLLAYARGSASMEDIDVVLFAEEGSPIAVDEAPDAHPTVILCPPHPARVYLAVHAAGGEGLVAVAAQLVPPARAAEVGRAAGAHGARGEAPRPADAWPGLEERIRQHRAALGGTWEDIRRSAMTVDVRASSAVPLAIDANQCVDVLVIPEDGVLSMELDVVDADGREVAHARDGGKDRSLVLCSTFAMTGSLRIRPHAGAGLAAVVIGRTPSSSAPDLATHVQLLWYATGRTVEQTRAAFDAALARRGYGAPTVFGAGSLTAGRRATLAGEVPSGDACARIDILAGAPLALFAARARDDKGKLLGAGEGASMVTVYACGTSKAELELDAYGRGGPFVALARSERWRSPVFAKKPTASSRMLGRSQGEPGGPLEGTLGDVRSVALDAMHLERWEVTIAARTCVEIAVGAEGEGTGLSLSVIDVSTGEEIDRSHGATSAFARACGVEAPRRVRVELAATSGKLDAVVGDRRIARLP